MPRNAFHYVTVTSLKTFPGVNGHMLIKPCNRQNMTLITTRSSAKAIYLAFRTATIAR